MGNCIIIHFQSDLAESKLFDSPDINLSIFFCVKLITTPLPSVIGWSELPEIFADEFCLLTCDRLAHGSVLCYRALGGWVNVVCGGSRLRGPPLRVNDFLWTTATILQSPKIRSPSAENLILSANSSSGSRSLHPRTSFSSMPSHFFLWKLENTQLDSDFRWQ